MRGLRPVAHGNARLDPKVLHDDFLDVSVTAVQLADGEQSIDPVLERLADADEQSGGEGNLLLAGFFYGTQAPGGNFVRGVVMGGACPQQKGVGGF